MKTLIRFNWLEERRKRRWLPFKANFKFETTPIYQHSVYSSEQMLLFFWEKKLWDVQLCSLILIVLLVYILKSFHEGITREIAAENKILFHQLLTDGLTRTNMTPNDALR